LLRRPITHFSGAGNVADKKRKFPKLEPVRYMITHFGARVFPVAVGTKRPLVKWGSEYASSLDEFEKLRKRFPGCNWGINCGKSRLCVFDLDVRDGKDGVTALAELEEKIGEPLPKGFTVRTHSGGLHYYTYGAYASSKNKLGNGIDVKSVGGFVVAPGSVGKHGDYVVECDDPPPELPEVYGHIVNQPGRKDPNRHIDVIELDQEDNIMWVSDYLLHSADIAVEFEGGNDTTYKTACAVRDLGISQDMAFDLMSGLWNERCKPPWSDEELAQIVANAYKYSQDPAGAKAVENFFQPVTEIDPTLPGIITPEKQEKISSSYDYLSAVCGIDDFQSFRFPKKETLVDPWLLQPCFILLTGDRGVGKTWFGLTMTFAVASGRNFGPWDTLKSVRTLYFEAEMAGVDQQERINQLCRGEKPPENFKFLSGAMLHEKGMKQFNLNDKKCRDAMTKVLVGLDIKFWVLDNLASTSSGSDENDKMAWDAVNDWCLYLRHLGITTVLIHHNNKQGNQRGTSHREDNTDLQISLKAPLGYKIEDGACFEVVFNKTRQFNRRQLQKMVGYRFQLNEGEYVEWEWTQPNVDSRLEILLLLAQGLSNKEVHESTGIPKTTISNALKYGKRNGWFSRKGNITEPGREYFAPYLKAIEDPEEEDEHDDLFD